MKEKVLTLQIIAKYDGNYKDTYEQYKQLYRNEIKAFERNKCDLQLLNSTNRNRDMWKIINSHIGNKPNHMLPSGTDPESLADEFNNLFSLSNKPNNLNQQNILIPSNQNSFYLLPTCEYELRTVVNSFGGSGSAGIDGIPANFLKKCVDQFVKPLSHIINSSFMSGCFPDRLKHTIVLPIHKKGCCNNINNYRPISILTAFSKLIEKIVFDRLSSYFKKFNLISKFQHGFIKGKSTETALYELVDSILAALENKEACCGVMLDLSKAFDSIDHQILLKKLEYYGVRGTALSWFTSYLSNRKQTTVIKSKSKTTYSKDKVIGQGVPQGSVLGPFLFLIYINDLHNIQNQSNHLMINFADDTTILLKGNSIREISDTGSIYIKKIEEWLQSNNLKLNQQKTNVLVFSTRQANPMLQNVEFNNCIYQTVSSARLLGIVIDGNLKWREHIDMLCCTLSKLCFAMRQIKDLVSEQVLRIVYSGCCYTRIKYGIIVWGGSSDLCRVFTYQKKLLRIMLHLNIRQSCRGYFKKLNILTLVGIYILEILLFFFKNKHLLHEYISTHDYGTRHKDRYCLPKHRLTLSENGPTYVALKIHNKLPNHIKVIKNLHSFRQACNRLLLQIEPYSLQEYFDYIT